MGETLNLLFEKREDGTYELRVKESWSGRTVSGNFVPPYTNKQLNSLLKKLNSLESAPHELREIGLRLFLALCGSEIPGSIRRESSEQSVQAVLRSVIQRTLKRRGTVALTFCFGTGCEEFVRYPWELLHNGDHFLLVSGIFTLTRALLGEQSFAGCELPVHLPMRILYIGASPIDCAPLETESSFQALERGLATLLENGQIMLDRLEPPTFDELVRYLNSYGGAGVLDDNETAIPCYVVHFDGHGAYGRLCPQEGCETVNEAEARKCAKCGSSLGRIRPQTYLCFCDDDGYNRFIDTHSLCDLFLSSDVRLAVFSACETAFVTGKDGRQSRQSNAVDATLATALVMAQVPAVVAMPFSLQDDLSPTFMYHFYEALADGRTLEEALSRSRQALLPMQQKSWFIPVLYRHVVVGEEGPVPLIVSHDAPTEHEHPLSHLGISSTFVGRERELSDLDALLTAAASGQLQSGTTRSLKSRVGSHLVVLTGSAGIGKSALAFEAVRRNQEKFPGGVIGVSLQDGKSFGDALVEIIHHLHITTRILSTADIQQRARLAVTTFRSLANRELPTLLLLDGFEGVKDRDEIDAWLHFLCSLPQEVVVLVTSPSNPGSMMVLEGPHCRWYEYHVSKMADADLLKLFVELASESGLDQHIHLDDANQQAVLREICTLLDGYPLGAELIFGTARTIDGRVYTPEAASRSLEEVRDELRNTPLAGVLAALEVSYRRLTPLARLLLSYLSAFNLPFSREQIIMLVAPDTLASSFQPVRLVRENEAPSNYRQDEVCLIDEAVPAALLENWRPARDELVQASFVQFDGRVYSIHSQVRYFAIAHLPIEESRRVHRVIAAYYANLPQPGPEEWFAAFDHLESAGEAQDMQQAADVAVRASWSLCGRGHAAELMAMLQRAGVYASRLNDRTCEGRIQCCLGAILRLLGRYTEAAACLRTSVEFHKHDRREAGWALYELAMLCREEGNFRQASTYAQEALALFREAADTRGETWVHMVVGEISRGYGTYYEALGHFELALASFQKLSDKEGYAATLRNRGTICEALGQYTKALNDYDEALRIFNELDLRTGQAWVLADRGVVYADQGNSTRAEKSCSESIAIFREQGIRRGEGWALRAMGEALWERRDVVQARTCYAEAAAVFRAIGDRVDLARVLNAQGAISFEEKECLTAKDLFEQAQSIAHDHGARQIEGRALRGLADVARVLQRFSEAERWYQEAMTIAVELDTPAERCAVLRRLGLLHQARGNLQDALSYWVQALALDQRLGHRARADLQQKVDALVSEHDMQQVYAACCAEYGLS
jgi:tetratricopeptide (TPR) repeat protein